MGRNQSVLGIYQDRATVADAMAVLLGRGYRPADIAVLVAENSGSKDFGHEKRSKGLEGAAAGSAMGAITGAAVGWLVSSGTVSIASLQPLAAVGTLIAVLAAGGCGGAIGWVIGLFLGMGTSEYVAKRYAGRKGRGGILLSVHCDDRAWCTRAEKLLRDTGARSVSCAPEDAADFATSDKPRPSGPWQKSSRIGNAGETACATIANQQFAAQGAGIQPAGTSATGCSTDPEPFVT